MFGVNRNSLLEVRKSLTEQTFISDQSADAQMRQEVVGIESQGLFVLGNRPITIADRFQAMPGKVAVSVGDRRINPDRFPMLSDSLAHVPQDSERDAQIVMSLSVIGIHAG